MRFIPIKFAVAVFLILATSAHAEEEAAKGGEAGGKEEDKAQHEYSEKQGKLNGLATKLEESDKHFHELVEEKENATTNEAKQDIIKEMVKLTNDRAKDAEAYTSLKSELTLRYPNQGEALQRRYQTENPRSLEQLDGAAGLDELLTRTKKMIDKKYAPFNAESDRKPASVQKPVVVEEVPRLRLEK